MYMLYAMPDAKMSDFATNNWVEHEKQVESQKQLLNKILNCALILISEYQPWGSVVYNSTLFYILPKKKYYTKD